MITYGGPELLVGLTVLVITPLIYVLGLRRLRVRTRVVIIALIWAISALISYWDVYWISKEADRLCREEAGLHSYRTVRAKGILGSTNIRYWAEYGFTYVEGLYKGEKTRFTVKDDDVKKETVSEYISHYQIETESEALGIPLVKTKERIVERTSGEVLGEIVAFKIYPGWLDKQLLGLLGFTWIPPRCDGDYLPEQGKRTLHIRDLVQSVVKPIRENEGN
jgi:hypothetical protein